MDLELASINEILLRLQDSKDGRRIFGADSHRFRLHPPLRESEITAFELARGVRLPTGYREFLVRVGNGGAGPGHGVFKLQEMDDGHGHRKWRENDGFVGTLSRPFPHAENWNDLAGKPTFDESQSPSEAEEDERMAQIDQWEAEHYWNPRHVNGAIPICHLGCALRQWLVITGPEAGNVWNDYRVDEKGLFPVKIGSSDRVNFIQWYQEWLTSAVSLCLSSRID